MNPEQDPSLSQPTPVAPTAPAKSSKAKKTAAELLVLLLVGVLCFAAGYYVRGQANTSPKTATSASSKTNSGTSDYAEGYRGGTAGVKLTETADKVADLELQSIALYYKQNGAYPSSSNEYMTQILWKYGYNEVAAGPSIKCPQYNGYFSYMALKNQTTAKYDTFDLYYCKGALVVKKTQADTL